MDFGVWSLLEQKACAISHKNTDALKQVLLKCWDEIDKKTLRATCAQVPTRLRLVIRGKGRHLEYMAMDINQWFFVFYLRPHLTKSIEYWLIYDNLSLSTLVVYTL